MATFTRSTIKIPSRTAGWNIDAWQYLPWSESESESAKKHAVIIMAHGFTLPKTMSLEQYATTFAAVGYAVLLFDYRRWGDSDGIPRQLLILNEQLDDYRTVIEHARQSELFDPTKIILWGTSFSGGHIMQLASEDHTIAAVLGQCPFSDGLASVSSLSTLTLLKVMPYAIWDRLKLALGLRPIYVPISAPHGKFAVLTTYGTDRGLRKLQTNEGDYTNKVQASCIFQFPLYRPGKRAAKIACPLFFSIPERDNLCPPKGALDAVKAAPKGEFVRIKGVLGHFDSYPAFDEHEIGLKAQVDFLLRVIPV
ncbi:hypothetical protein BOTBODRAFT_36262 [Botryobasidium botryosum FD-172 SS1]|uniref:Serine aminopeptidase S33 domain-containing protein n=1 Tax=Botryobasidium botryosum (strain FD-172 SS1) TaxID=930990 RepID=A0A067M4B2_BOTB1|nr:hypothetical protein BOTBODRAFT_36262 [Botryobasidium botryosum FD-172 SS1]